MAMRATGRAKGNRFIAEAAGWHGLQSIIVIGLKVVAAVNEN
jgi:hypothetical protein